MTPQVQAMPELPVVAHLNPLLSKTLTDLQLAELKHHAGQPGKTLAADYDVPLCKVSDAITYAESLRVELEAARAALSAMLTHMGMDEDEWNKPTFDQARAALKGRP